MNLTIYEYGHYLPIITNPTPKAIDMTSTMFTMVVFHNDDIITYDKYFTHYVN